MARGLDFKQKQVIRTSDGKIIGFVYDVDANFEKGEIHSIIVAENSKLFGGINAKSSISIPWGKIKLIGEDVILVDI